MVIFGNKNTTYIGIVPAIPSAGTRHSRLCLRPFRLCLRPLRLCLRPLRLCLRPLRYALDHSRYAQNFQSQRLWLQSLVMIKLIRPVERSNKCQQYSTTSYLFCIVILHTDAYCILHTDAYCILMHTAY